MNQERKPLRVRPGRETKFLVALVAIGLVASPVLPAQTNENGLLAKHWVIADELVQGIAIGDVDNDGELELAACLPRAKEVRVLDSTCRVKHRVTFTGAPRSIAIEDVDGDGRNELLVGTSGPIPCPGLDLGCVYDGEAGNLIIGEISGIGVFSTEWVSPPYYFRFSSQIAVGDLNKNGKKEVILGLTFYDRTLIAHEFNGSTYPVVFEDPIGSDVDSVFVSGEFLIVGTKCWSDYGLRVYHTNNLIFSNLGAGKSDVSAGDLNGDGDVEIAHVTGGSCGGGETPAALSVYDSKFQRVYFTGALNAAPSWSAYLTTGKLLGGGGSELVLGTSAYSQGHSVVHIFQSSSGSYQRVWQDPRGPEPVDVFSLLIGDVARDGHNELYSGQTKGLVVYLPETEPAPRIWKQPTGLDGFVGESAELSIFATGSWPLTYAWWRNGAVLPGASGATLVLTNVTLGASGDYAVVVTNTFGSVTSAVARVTITERPWPYFENFQGSVGREWSHRQTDVTPVGNRRFLGQFGNDVVTLTLGRLPPHQGISVSFDLFLLNSWDGSTLPAQGGPDIWDLSVAGGPTLLHATFQNYDGSGAQSFPDNYPGRNYPPHTGAAETNTLGASWGRDTVYHLAFTFPHSLDSVALNFSGIGLQHISDESWGLDNVRIALTPDPTNTTTFVRSTLVPVYAAPAPVSNSFHRVAISGTRGAALCGDGSVQWLDLSNPARPSSLGRWLPFLSPSSLAVASNLVFITSWELDFFSTVEIVDFSDPAHPVLRGYYDTPGYAQDVALAGSLAYVADDEGGLHILDVSNPSFPERVGGFNVIGPVEHVEVSGHYAYIKAGNWLCVLDVSNPADPRRVGVCEIPGGIEAMTISGPKLYLALAAGELRVLDVTDPPAITWLGGYRAYGIQAIAVNGRFAYLATGSHGLQLLDVSNPTNLTWLTGVWHTPAEDVALLGNYAVIAGGNKGLVIYDLQQHLYPPLSPPTVAGEIMTMTWPYLAGARLQMATNLNNPVWWDVPGSALTNSIGLPVAEGAAFFRLVKN